MRVESHRYSSDIQLPFQDMPGRVSLSLETWFQIRSSKYLRGDTEPNSNFDFFSIVAIHGEAGHWEGSWTDSKTGFFWLRDSLPQQFPAARVYSYSPRSTFDNVAETLLFDLLHERSIHNRSGLALILIGLSLGGTLAKKLFIESSPSRNSKDEVKELHSKIAGFIFLGTRHSDSFDSSYSKMASVTAGLFKASKSLSHLAIQAENLLRMLDAVPSVNSDFKLLKGEQLPRACFYETEPVSVGAFRTILVPRLDAIIESDGYEFSENRQLDSNHQNLAKFSGGHD